MRHAPFVSLARAALLVAPLAASPAACGGHVVLDGSGTTTSSSSSSSSSGAPLPQVCEDAASNVSWASCAGSALYPWAQGMGATWQDVFDAQCAAQSQIAACQAQVDAYYQCLATHEVACMPCDAGVDVGECKGTDGIVSANACSDPAFEMFECTGK